MTYASPSFRLVLLLAAIGSMAAGAVAQTPWSVARNRQLGQKAAPRVQRKAWIRASEPRVKTPPPLATPPAATLPPIAPPPAAPPIEKPEPATPPAPMAAPPTPPVASVAEQPKPVVQPPVSAPPVLAKPKRVTSSSPMACELRLVRLSDGRVLLQRSRLSAVHMLPQMVSEMVSDLVVAMDGDAQNIVIVSLGNRRQTPMGKALAKELTYEVTTQMNRATRRNVYSVDLRQILRDELEIERATHLMTHPEVRKRIAGAQYAIQGGVAICGPETRVSPPADDTLNR